MRPALTNDVEGLEPRKVRPGRWHARDTPVSNPQPDSVAVPAASFADELEHVARERMKGVNDADTDRHSRRIGCSP